MTRALLIVLLTTGCSPNSGDLSADASDMFDAWAADAPGDSEPGALGLNLGGRDEPFEPWTEGAAVLVIQGPQGGFHTEHAALVTGTARADLHLAVVWGEVWRDDLVLARAGWEFWNDQWEPSGSGHRVELPVLIFDEQPALGPAEIRGLAELRDGRTAEFERTIDLVAPP